MQWRIAGTEARIRVSSVIVPASSCGTFRSARMKTRLPATSTSARRLNRIAALPAYFAFIRATAVSSMRLEKPHSLSYQLDTFTNRPATLVSVAS